MQTRWGGARNTLGFNPPKRPPVLRSLSRRVFVDYIYPKPIEETFKVSELVESVKPKRVRRIYDVIKVARDTGIISKIDSMYYRTGILGFYKEKKYHETLSGNIFLMLVQNTTYPGLAFEKICKEFGGSKKETRRIYDVLNVLLGAGIILCHKYKPNKESDIRRKRYYIINPHILQNAECIV